MSQHSGAKGPVSRKVEKPQEEHWSRDYFHVMSYFDRPKPTWIERKAQKEGRT